MNSTTDPGLGAGVGGITTSLLLNVIFRAIFSVAAAAACWVPMRLLWKNGELAGTTFAIVTIILNIFNAINCLIWHNDNTSHWWDGEGWCDLQAYVTLPLETMYAACVLAIMRHIANQVALMRVTSLSGSEKRRKLMIQALIIFAIPAVQVALTYPVLAGRYSILTVVGCRPIYAPSWVTLVFFVLPCPILSLLAAYFAVLIYVRYRQIDESTRAAVWDSNNSSVQSRSARTKRKLYFMSLCVVVPYLPIQIAYLVLNILADGPWTGPFSFSQAHGPFWGFIPMVTSHGINGIIMYEGYISVLTVIVIFVFFGRTKEAHDTYRRYLRFFGLGKIWPTINEEWFPDHSRTRNLGSSIRSWRDRVSELTLPSSSASYSRKGSLIPTARHVSAADNSSEAPASNLTAGYAANCPVGTVSESQTLSPTHQNPWVFRNMMGVNYPIRLPRFSVPNIFGKKAPNLNSGSESGLVPLESVTCPPTGSSTDRRAMSEDFKREGPWERSSEQTHIHTKVWSDDADEINPMKSSGQAEYVANNQVLVKTQIAHSMKVSGRGPGM